MTKNISVCILLATSFLFSMNMICIADGGAGFPGGCENIPTPDYDGPLLEGTFIAAYDKGPCENDNACKHFNTHIELQGMKMNANGRTELHKKLYAINKAIKLTAEYPNPRNLCDYDHWELKQLYRYIACKRDVAEEFGYDPTKYYPVLTDVTVTQKDNCGDISDLTNYHDPLISGTIKIRMTPHATGINTIYQYHLNPKYFQFKQQK